jgi:hypothetical protein
MGGVRISDFTTTGGLTNISNLNNGCPLNKYDYSKFSGQKVSVRQGDSFQFNITGTWHMAIYIDWNQDYDFSESNEMVSYNQLTGTITVPADAVAGNTRMRIICFYSPGPGVPPGGCGIPRRGETEDYLIEILPAVPVTVSVQNLTVGDGMDTCFNATQTLTVAGEGTTFLAQVGSNSTFIAGQMIRLLPTTTAQYGSYLHGYISSSGNYCWPLKSSSFLSQDDNQPGRHNAGNEVSGIVRIIPNPTFGEFIAEIEKAKKDCIVEAKIYSINGNLITSKNFPSGTRMAFSLMDLPDGLYFITLSTTERMFTGKILIQK